MVDGEISSDVDKIIMQRRDRTTHLLKRKIVKPTTKRKDTPNIDQDPRTKNSWLDFYNTANALNISDEYFSLCIQIYNLLAS